MHTLRNAPKVVLVDCFDTIIFRREHPLILLKQWAICVERLYPQLEAKTVYEFRKKFTASSPESPAFDIYEKLYTSLFAEKERPKRDRFVEDCHRLECVCERSTQFLCGNTVEFLKRKKAKGCQICCVSDFHLYASDLWGFFKALGISDLFDKVYSSADEGVWKRSGKLYEHVLADLGVSPQECIMIGDNRHSDVQRSREKGIATQYRPHFLRRAVFAARYRLMKKGLLQESKETLKKDICRIRKTHESFEEYAAVFFVFCARLYKEVVQNGGTQVTFLAREGYFLKACFEQYQKLCIPHENQLKTAYFKCSRQAIYSVQQDKSHPIQYNHITLREYLEAVGFSTAEIEEFSIDLLDLDERVENLAESRQGQWLLKEAETQDKKEGWLYPSLQKKLKENVKAFQIYCNQIFGEEKTVHLVDVGWTGRMQQGIEKLTGRKTYGYYIGIYGEPEDPYMIERVGLIFNRGRDGKLSSYYHLLRTNTQLYEQLLAAPHGSARSYRLTERGVEIAEAWEEQEETLYKREIGKIQERMSEVFQHFCIRYLKDCATRHVDKVLAFMVLRSALLQTKVRVGKMEMFCNGFAANFTQENAGKSGKKGLVFNPKAVKIKPIEIIVAPERYTRYFAKVGLWLEKKGLSAIRGPINLLIYIYVSALTRLKGPMQ